MSILILPRKDFNIKIQRMERNSSNERKVGSTSKTKIIEFQKRFQE